MARTRFETADLLADPYGALRRARGGSPVVQLDFGGAAVMTHERVRTLLADGRLRGNLPEFLRTFGVSSGPFYEWIADFAAQPRGRRASALAEAHGAHLHATQRRAPAAVPARRGARAHRRLRGARRVRVHGGVRRPLSVARPLRADRRPARRTASASAAGPTRSASASARWSRSTSPRSTRR